MGAFGLDDVILAAPTKRTLNVLLDICVDFSFGFRVNYNHHKCKLIAYP